MEELTTFANQLKQSELLPSETLRDLLRQFQQEGKKEGKRTADLTVQQLCDFLVKRQAVTNWQAEKLQAGRFRGFFLGKYKLLDRLGAGGMSVVYLAENRVLGQQRAIKVLPKSRVENTSYLARFYKEARAAAALDHPNIVKTYDIDSEDDQHFMVMEFVKGEDLSELVKREGPLPIHQGVDFIRQAAEALAHAHQNQLVHRDVKPSNFLVAGNSQIKMMDLGLAKTSDDSASLTMMHNETLMGTADYLSPEQALNSHEVDHRTDIYSLGGTLYFVLAGHPPFPEGSIAQRLVKHQSIDPPSLDSVREDCPAEISQLCQSLMKKKPEDRIQSCDEVAGILSRWLSENPAQKTLARSAKETPNHAAVSSKEVPASPAAAAKVEKAKDEPKPAEPISSTTKPAPVPSKSAQSKSASPKTSPTNVPQPKPKKNAAVSVAPTIAGHELVNAGEVQLNIDSSEASQPQAVSQPVNVAGSKSVAAGGISIQAESSVRRNRSTTGTSKRRPKKQDAKWILISLVVLLVVAAAFLVWAFVFQGSTPPPKPGA